MMRQRFQNLKDRKRSIGLIAAAVLVIGGVAFALLQSQAKLAGNSIETDGTGLLISQNDSNYAASTTGYDFAHIIPGSQPSQTEHFFLKNTGSTPLSLKLSAAGPSANPGNIDLSKVNIIVTPYSTTTFMPGTPLSFSLQSLISSNASGGTAINYPAILNAASKEEFNIQVAMDPDAVNGSSSAALSNIDLTFIGTAVASTN